MLFRSQFLPPSKIQRLGLNPVSQIILQPNFATCRFQPPSQTPKRSTDYLYYPVANLIPTLSLYIVAHFLLQKASDSLSLSLSLSLSSERYLLLWVSWIIKKAKRKGKASSSSSSSYVRIFYYFSSDSVFNYCSRFILSVFVQLS